MVLGARSNSARWAIAAVCVVLAGALVTFVPTPPASAASAADSAEAVRTQGTLGDGYALVASDGGIFNYGDSDFFGSTGALPLNKPIVGMEYTPTGEGYWLVASDGGIFAFGDAEFFGSTGALKLNKPIVGMTATPTGRGYWLVASDGGIFAFGDAEFFGSTGALRLNQPVVGIAAHPSGKGYWLVASDGGIFTFGAVQFFGSTGALKLNKPIVDIAPTETGNGYWMVASDGGIFAFGDAQFFGSQGGKPLNQPINGMTVSPTGQGYWMVASDGGIFSFGDAPFFGSRGGAPLNKPIVGMAATPFTPGTSPDFVVDLEGEQEVGGGDLDGSGSARLDFTEDELCWYLQTDNVEPATAAHIHEGPLGVNGPVVFEFTAPDADGISVGCKPIEKAFFDAVMANPQRYYVNVHSASFPGGAVRGQLVDELVLASTSDDRWVVFFASTPEDLLFGPAAFTGHGGDESIVGIDVRQETGTVFVVTKSGTTGRLYTSDASGALTRVGSSTFTLNGTFFGVDVHEAEGPGTPPMVVIVSDVDENIQVNGETGVGGTNPSPVTGADRLTGIALTNNTAGWGIDSGTNTAGTFGFGNGIFQPTGPLGVDISDTNGFDQGLSGAFVLAGAVGSSNEVFAVNVTRSDFGNVPGRTVRLGVVGDGTIVVTGLTLLT